MIYIRNKGIKAKFIYFLKMNKFNIRDIPADLQRTQETLIKINELTFNVVQRNLFYSKKWLVDHFSEP